MASEVRIGWKPKFNDARVASVRFRCLTPLHALQQMGMPIEIFDPRVSSRYSLVIFSKLYEPSDLKLARELAMRGCKTVLDLSDNHFYNPRGLPQYVVAAANLRAMVAEVDRVVCCSVELARWVAIEAAPRRPPVVIGDAVETLSVIRNPISSGCFRVVWFGSHGSPNAPSGMEDLLRIRPQINELGAAHPSELVVVSNNLEKFNAIRGAFEIPMRYVEWTPDSFANELGTAGLVVVPITPNPFTLCKSNNRVATALWYGVPVLADSIPAYEPLRPFAYIDDWVRGFRDALSGAPEMRRRTEAGQSFVRKHFTGEVIANAWRCAIETIGRETDSRVATWG